MSQQGKRKTKSFLDFYMPLNENPPWNFSAYTTDAERN